MPQVSVVVTTKNEQAHIGRCLGSIKAQTFQDLEIIVVDNHSTDRTIEVAKSFTDQIITLGPERSAQRNAGVASSSAPLILYLDADMILTTGVLADCVKRMRADPNLQALYIPERVTGDGFWVKVRRFERAFYDGTVVDAVRFVRREAFDAIGGFDLNLTGTEDWDFDLKMRHHGKVDVATAELHHNEDGFSLKRYFSKKSYYTPSFAPYIAKWGADHPDLRRQMGIKYRYFTIYFEHGKWRRLLSHPILAIAMYYLRFRIGINYLRRNTNQSI